MLYFKSIWNRFRKAFFDSFLNGKSFAFWGVLVLLVNFVMLHGQGFASDLAYWRAWLVDLQNGVGGFRGDYPPFYILWLRVVAWFYHATDLSMDLAYELKQFCLFPVILAHISLTHFVWLRIRDRQWLPEIKMVLMLLVVANPVLYLDGPVWGQVDVLPVTICVWALWYAAKPKTYALGMGLFMLGLLTKFQMIMFLPVFGAISLRYRKIMWKALLSAGAVFALVFLPFIVAGKFGDEFSRAYMNTLNSYPYAAMNAGNLWMALVGNMTPQDRTFFEGAPAFFNPGLIGKILFVLVSIGALLSAFFKRLSASRLMILASFNALAFFMLLPCMHERYVLASAVMCIGGASAARKPNLVWPVVLSIIAYLNVSMLMSTRGVDLWFWISVGGVVSMVLFGFHMLAPATFDRLLGKIRQLPVPGLVPYVLLVIIYLADMGATFSNMAKSAYELKEGESFVYDLELLRQEQGYGSTNIGKTVDGNPMHLKGDLYLNGIGTHSPSLHEYALPEDATRFTVGCGVDDESGNGVIDCIILVDNREVWRSGRLEGRQIAFADIDVRGARRITLVTDEMGSKNFDHADWVNPVVHR